MPGLITLSLLAAAIGGSADAPKAIGSPSTRVSVSARASVRILPGARVSFDDAARSEGQALTAATVTAEDGSRRPAKLVEFQ
jgi:hypothetical protein